MNDIENNNIDNDADKSRESIDINIGDNLDTIVKDLIVETIKASFDDEGTSSSETSASDTNNQQSNTKLINNLSKAFSFLDQKALGAMIHEITNGQIINKDDTSNIEQLGEKLSNALDQHMESNSTKMQNPSYIKDETKAQNQQNNASVEFNTRLVKTLIVYEAYKHQTPHRIAGETKNENISSNIALKGVDTAKKHNRVEDVENLILNHQEEILQHAKYINAVGNLSTTLTIAADDMKTQAQKTPKEEKKGFNIASMCATTPTTANAKTKPQKTPNTPEPTPTKQAAFDLLRLDNKPPA